MKIEELTKGNLVENNGRLHIVACRALHSPGDNLLVKKDYFRCIYLMDVLAHYRADDLIPICVLTEDSFIRTREEVEKYIREIGNNMPEGSWLKADRAIILDLLLPYYEIPVVEAKNNLDDFIGDKYNEYDCDEETPEMAKDIIQMLEKELRLSEE